MPKEFLGGLTVRRNPKGKGDQTYAVSAVKSGGFEDDEIANLNAKGLTFQKTIDERAILATGLTPDGVADIEKEFDQEFGEKNKQLSVGKFSYFIKYFGIFVGVALIIAVAISVFR